MNDPSGETKHVLLLRGRGYWRRPEPFVAEVVPGSRPYLWLGHGDHYLAALTPAEARRLADFITAQFGRNDLP